MRQSERASIMRIVSDLIAADGIIDAREIIFLDSLREKYGIKKEDEVAAASYTFAAALNELLLADDSLKHDLLKEKVMGPYVFVYVNMVNEEWKFRYFILSRSQFIELLHSAHVWYKYDWYREKEISEKSPAGIDVKWLMGEDEPETKRHKAFVNPLKGVSCEDCWENIWKD